MNKKISLLISLGLCLMLALPGYAKKPSHKGGKIPVTATFRDCTGGSPYSGYEDPTDPMDLDPDCPSADDRIKSDGDPWIVPRPYIDGDAVGSKLSSANGHWRLGMHSVDGRSLSLDFSDCASGPGTCFPPTDGLTVGVAVMVTRGIDLRKMFADESKGDLQLLVPFTRDDDPWLLRFDPSDEQCPGSSFVSVTRGGGVAQHTWVIEASKDHVACLHLNVGGVQIPHIQRAIPHAVQGDGGVHRCYQVHCALALAGN